MNSKPDYVVEILRHGGRGVLVGEVILTAAHCIKWETNGLMALRDTVEEVKTHRGRFKVRPLAVEPVSDIVILGALDNQSCYNEALAFEEFCLYTKPVKLAMAPLHIGEAVQARILNRDGWTKGSGEVYELNSSTLSLKTQSPIEAGASGGPILNARGELIALVSLGGDIVTGPRPLMALPVWACAKFLAPDNKWWSNADARHVMRSLKRQISRIDRLKRRSSALRRLKS